MGEEGSGVLWGWVGVMKGLCNGREKEREKRLEKRERKREEKSVGPIPVIKLGPT